MTDDLKTRLRREARARRRVLAAADPRAAEKLAAHAADLPRRARVAGFWPLEEEIDVRPLLERLAAGGAEILLPRCEGRGAARRLAFRRFRFGDALAPGGFGVLEPLPTAEEARPDLVLAPLLAFDGSGGRLGYGAGWYDAALRELRADGPVEAVGVAYAGQEVERVPMSDRDEPLDGALTERGLNWFERKERA